MSLKAVSYRNWETRAKKIQNRNLKLHGRSLTWVSILGRMKKAIKEVRMNEKILLVNEEEYKTIRQVLLQEASQ